MPAMKPSPRAAQRTCASQVTLYTRDDLTTSCSQKHKFSCLKNVQPHIANIRWKILSHDENIDSENTDEQL